MNNKQNRINKIKNDQMNNETENELENMKRTYNNKKEKLKQLIT